MRRHEALEWDPLKATQNLRKHGVSFVTAANMLGDEDGDENHLETFDKAHSHFEDRWITFGTVPQQRTTLLRVVWTPRGENTRIISARKATKRERHEFTETKGS